MRVRRIPHYGIYNSGDWHRVPFAYLRNSTPGRWVESKIVVAAYQRWGLEPPYIDRNDWWLGYYRGPNHHYVCPLPTVVIRWRRRSR